MDEINIYENIEISDHPPRWIGENDLQIVSDNAEIRDIIRFFVANTPSFETSARSKCFSEYGWSSDYPKEDDYISLKLFEVAGLEKGKNLYIGDSPNNTKKLFNEANMGEDFASEYKENKIAITDDNNLIMNICKTIRNGFAHCRFTFIQIDDDILIAMENGTVCGKKAEGKKFKVKARIIIKLSTLKEWIRIIENDSYKEAVFLEEQQKKQENELLDVISSGNYIDTDDMLTRTSFNKSTATMVKKRLIDSGRIKYSRKVKKWIVLGE